uniref:Uncharacterized protein n=1 Tax=Knipowitschia caucasica TaxID=637954 RepID=A0AAV2LEK4_KNICA
MGLQGQPGFLDIRTAMSTYNFEQNADKSTRESVAQFMCHTLETQERFYALYKTVQKAQEMRQCFVALSCVNKAPPVPSGPASSSAAGPSTSAAVGLSASAAVRSPGLGKVRRRLLGAARGTGDAALKRTHSPSNTTEVARRIKSKYSPMKMAKVMLMDMRGLKKQLRNHKNV